MIKKLAILIWLYGFFAVNLAITTAAIAVFFIPETFRFWKAFQKFYETEYEH